MITNQVSNPVEFILLLSPQERVALVLAEWEQTGMTPIMLKVLAQRFDSTTVHLFATDVIGKDYCEINITEWINRLEHQGVSFPDGEPVFEILSELINRNRGTA